MMGRPIPGLGTAATGDLAVMKPFDPAGRTRTDALMVSRFLARLDWRHFLGLILILGLWPALAYAQGRYSQADAFAALVKWIPFVVTDGFFFNILISFFSMAIGTVFGIILGMMQISPIGMEKKLIRMLKRKPSVRTKGIHFTSAPKASAWL